jgi:glutamate-1-semialdehyde 2,1-aminomutase
MGVVPPLPGFLADLRRLADLHGCLPIFDEVVSGFRHCFGPVANVLGVRPDLICYGKAIGGGLPVGAYAGRDDVMSLLEERGSVFQGGTFAGSALTMAAGLSQLRLIQRESINDKLDELGAYLEKALCERFSRHKLPYSAQRYGSLVTPILVPNLRRLCNHHEVERQDKSMFRTVHRNLLRKNTLVPPTIEEPIFISSLHTTDDLDVLADAFVAGVLGHND